MIKIDLYELKITVRVFDSIEKLKKSFAVYAKKMNIEPDDEDDYYQARSIVNPQNSGDIYLLFVKDYLSINTITHENYHCTNRILSDQGVDLDPYNDESFAILNGYLNQEVFKYLKKKKYDING